MIFKPNFLGVGKAAGGVPRDGLVGEWLFSGNALDTSGNGYNGTVTGATLTTDRFNNTDSAYSFAQNDKITINNGIIDGTSLNFTISFWIYPTLSDGSYRTIFQFFGPTSRILFSYRLNSFWLTGTDEADPAFTVNINTWSNITISINGSSAIAYLNGVELYNDPSKFVSDYSDINNCGFGRIITTVFGMIGKTDDTRIYNRVLTQKEVTALYNEAS